ncbi:hypothetical protein HN51_062979 [Arachis hypogaea]|uniref:pollen-specific leucine-rich repeat extensin-like protein 1 isoform X1 n=1 Tax=Arachis ipaensis TaxID=130454 RepID=UPI0007AF4D2E|nr:pollen-specific leucine-rich repeat extensin-like protein 1 isoform X1 [Arachis ipaensis]XP_025629268.1 pollen-specific leucine-rich repeat extensin-like protein 1 isoform X1 [Arachis hypogaea]QHO20531.1 YLP motif-containing protein [Arachis hypogaea]
MDRQWYPNPNPNLNHRPIQPNVCPSCFIPHFPFCPPPPPTSSYYTHPPPLHAPPFQPPPPHAPSYWPPDSDRTFKRQRIDDPHSNFLEDERRLKLIRDHGVALASQQQHHQQPPEELRNHSNYTTHVHQNGFPNFPQNGQFSNGSYAHDSSSGSYHYQAHTPPPPPHDFRNLEGNQGQLNGRVVQYPYPYAHSDNVAHGEASRFFRGQPPLPSSPPPPLPPADPPINHSLQLNASYFSPPKKPGFLFPVHGSSPASVAPSPSSYSQVPEAHALPRPYFQNKQVPEFSTSFPPEEPSRRFLGDAQPFSLKQLPADKPKVTDASHLFMHPHRASRPDHFVIILRGLPGSGKSYLAKMLRDLEVENGGDAPRIHSMDDYFMTEVEKVEDSDTSKSSSSGRSKKLATKKVMEYCYEPEMEEAYRSSMLKAFKKTVEEGSFTFVIVDDRNLRVADFAQFWATAKRSGYEVYILEATYKDPVGCAARNVHGFTQEDIEKMSRQWEEAPSLYLQLDVKSLFHGDDLKESRIQEVDMDMEDDIGDALPAAQGREAEKVVDPLVRDDTSSIKEDVKGGDAEGEHPTEVRELGKSKWSEDFGEDDTDQTEGMRGNINALSGLIHQYGKERKSVHWGDQAGKSGFSIGAARKLNGLSLVIGPGAGYNLKSNPLHEEESLTHNSREPKKGSIFQEQIRAERESFKAVFDRRRHRIGGLSLEED